MPQASLIGQLDSLGLLAPGHCYVEMGAGKGELNALLFNGVNRFSVCLMPHLG